MTNTANEYTDEQRNKDLATTLLVTPLWEAELKHLLARRDEILDGTDDGKELSEAEERELKHALDAIDTEYARQDAERRLAKGR